MLHRYPLFRQFRFCFLALSFLSVFKLSAQEINLQLGNSKPAPNKPIKTYKPAATPTKVYKQTSVKVASNVSAKVLINIESEGKNIRSEFIIGQNEVGSYLNQNIYVGDATLELRLPNGKSYRYNQFLSIDPDIATLDISLSASGYVDVVVKTNAQIREEARLRNLDLANGIVSTLSNSVVDLFYNKLAASDFSNALGQLRYKDLIDKNTQSQGEALVNAIESLQGSFNSIKGRYDDAAFYKNTANYVPVSNSRAALKQAQYAHNKMQAAWSNYTYSNLFLTRIEVYLNLVEEELKLFPWDKESFNKKVAETIANWERIQEEERKRKQLELERIERERQARIKREQEEAEQRERMRLLEQYRFNEWNNKSGVFLAGSIPFGVELGVLASDRLGNMFGFRYFSNESDYSKMQVYNCMTFPIDGAFQGGVTLGFGAQETDVINPDLEDGVFWEYGVSVGGRLMYVDHKVMLGLEASIGSESARGLFFIAGFKIGGL